MKIKNEYYLQKQAQDSIMNIKEKILAAMCVGRGQGALAPLDFENFSKKRLFFSFEWEKQISSFLAPEKFQKNPLVTSLEKILPTPMLAAKR